MKGNGIVVCSKAVAMSRMVPKGEVWLWLSAVECRSVLVKSCLAQLCDGNVMLGAVWYSMGNVKVLYGPAKIFKEVP